MRNIIIKKVIPLFVAFSLITSFGVSHFKHGSNQQEFVLKSYQTCPIQDFKHHTMGKSLYKYMDMKIHHLLKEREFDNIWIVGDKDRSCEVSKYEKNDKMFNWQRPTAEIRGNDLYVKVFPGREYVKHYALLISTYFALQNKNWQNVRYVYPDETEAWNALTASNINEIPEGDVAIVGYGLDQIIDEEEIKWEGEGSFSWVKRNIGDREVVFIGGKHSYWGDIAGRIVTLLAKKGYKQVIYIGKVGGMSSKGIPNQTLASGNTSFVDGEIIKWHNVFDFAMGEESIIFGKHYTIPSVLNETKDWLEENRAYDFVDNEIGFMAKAALSESIGFSYLHIISDNLNGGYEEDLSNERGDEAKAHRKVLLKKAKELIERCLAYLQPRQ